MKRFFIASLIITSMYSATLKSLKFDGLVHISQEVASEMIDMKKGDQVDIEKIDKAIKTLYKQKYFEDIWVEEVGDGGLVFHFKEKPTIAKIDIAGIGTNDKDKIVKFLGMSKGEVFDESKAVLSGLRISQYYEAQGYFDTVVEHTVEPLNKSSIVVKFQVNRGQEIFIKKVNVSGAKKLVYSDFEPKIANKEAEIFPWMWGFNDGKLRLSDLPNDSNRIKDVYMQNGFLDAKVSTPFLKAYLDGYTANLTYNVEEGKQYKVGSVNIDIPKSLEKFVSIKDLKKEMVLETGDIFDIDKLRRDIKKVEIKVADLGYAYVRVIPDIKKDSKKATTDVSLRVLPGDKVYINEVRISGNSRTIDRVIRRDVFLAAGDLYSRTDLDDSKNTLKRSSYFDDVKIKEKRISRNKIDIVVDVKEASTGSIGGGIGYGSADGLLLSANVSDSNVFGSGMKISVKIDKSNKQLSGTVSLNNPRVFDSIYSLGGSIYRIKHNYYEYDVVTTGFNLTAGRTFGRNWRGSLGYSLENKTYSNFISGINYVDSLKSSITPALSYNTTDSYYLPRRGIDFKSSLELAGLGGDAKFAKSVTKFNYFYGLKDSLRYDLILRYKSQARYIVDNGFIPYDEYIKMGGIGTVRGYSSDKIYPTQIIDGTTVYGGNMMFVNSIEASFPLIERLKMRGALFLDYGMIGQDNLNIKRGGTGAALEWISPLGPISLVFAKALLKEVGDKTSSFEFTIGRQF